MVKCWKKSTLIFYLISLTILNHGVLSKMRIKLNWGVGAFSLFGAFVLMMLSFVYITLQQNIDLVTEDYYEKEVDFDNLQREKANAIRLPEQVTWLIENDQFVITIPNDSSPSHRVSVVFYKTSDKSLDRKYEFKQTSDSKLHVPLQDLAQGMYQLQVRWTTEKSKYYHEEGISISQISYENH